MTAQEIFTRCQHLQKVNAKKGKRGFTLDQLIDIMDGDYFVAQVERLIEDRKISVYKDMFVVNLNEMT